MKTNIIILFLLLSINIFSQNGNVGINTSAPQATLDIRGKNDTTPASAATPGGVAATDGILVPRVSDLATNGTINGQLVYLVADTTTPAFTKGFYYWNGTVWAPVGGGATADGDAWGVSGEDIASNIKRTGSVAIGSTATTAPNAYSKLDVSSTNQGILIPRINLTSNTLNLGTGTQPESLVIYNSGTTLPKGFYFWTGSEWRIMLTGPGVNPAISSLDCSNAKLSPSVYTAGTPYTGTLTIPYTGGNGGFYAAGTGIASTGVTGLTATLQAGTLASGNGSLTYTVTGNPSASSPSTATFAIPAQFGATGCSSVVGQGEKGAISQYAQVSWEEYDSTSGEPNAVGSLATIYANVGIKQVKRINDYCVRVDFTVPFPDDKYIVSGVIQESLATLTNNIGIYMVTGGFIWQSNWAANYGSTSGIMYDAETSAAGSLTSGLEPRATLTRAGVPLVQMRYRTHCYIADGYGSIKIVAGSISFTR